MKLQPVFLAAQRSAPVPLTSRRAFLLAGCWFTGGVLVGGACGFTLGSAAAQGDLAPTGDSDLDELRRLAVQAPLEQLMEHHLVFLDAKSRDYSSDPVLWKGVIRIADAVLVDETIENRRAVVGFLLQTLENGNPPSDIGAESRIQQLRKLLQQLGR